ncbi:MAG: hypothetical protein U0414_19035 [Polyangiaceae bacterium]
MLSPARALLALPLMILAGCSPAPAPSVLDVSASSSAPARAGKPESAPRPKADVAVDRQALCGCYRWWTEMPEKKSDPCSEISAQDIAEATVLECLRAHDPGTDCQGYRECYTMEPSASAACLDDEMFIGACPSCRCGKKCDVKKQDCPKGFECTLENTHVEGQGWCAEK